MRQLQALEHWLIALNNPISSALVRVWQKQDGFVGVPIYDPTEAKTTAEMRINEKKAIKGSILWKIPENHNTG